MLKLVTFRKVVRVAERPEALLAVPLPGHVVKFRLHPMHGNTNTVFYGSEAYSKLSQEKGMPLYPQAPTDWYEAPAGEEFDLTAIMLDVLTSNEGVTCEAMVAESRGLADLRV